MIVIVCNNILNISSIRDKQNSTHKLSHLYLTLSNIFCFIDTYNCLIIIREYVNLIGH